MLNLAYKLIQKSRNYSFIKLYLHEDTLTACMQQCHARYFKYVATCLYTKIHSTQLIVTWLQYSYVASLVVSRGQNLFTRTRSYIAINNALREKGLAMHL